MARGNEKENRIVPDRQGRLAVLKDRASAGVDMMATGSAWIGLAGGNAVVGSLNTTGRAEALEAIPLFHDVLKAGVIIREPLEELADWQFGGNWFALAHNQEYRGKSYVCQGDNPRNRLSSGICVFLARWDLPFWVMVRGRQKLHSGYGADFRGPPYRIREYSIDRTLWVFRFKIRRCTDEIECLDVKE